MCTERGHVYALASTCRAGSASLSRAACPVHSSTRLPSKLVLANLFVCASGEIYWQEQPLCVTRCSERQRGQACKGALLHAAARSTRSASGRSPTHFVTLKQLVPCARAPVGRLLRFLPASWALQTSPETCWCAGVEHFTQPGQALAQVQA